MKRTHAILVTALLTAPTNAQQTDTDKSQYTLSNPTPRDLWRPLSADRPDITESPYTVDAGAVQLEMSFIDYAKNSRAKSWAVAPTNLKLGLLHNVDLQFVFNPYINEDDGTTTHAGFGDSQLRLKINLWGNDAGDTAFAIMPFLKLPTGSDDLTNDHVEGGLILPFSTSISETIGLGLMFETDFVYDDSDDDYDTEFIATAVIGFDATETIGLYIEGVGIKGTESDTDFQALLGLGGTYTLDPNTVLDAGVNIGLTDDTDDLNLFTGITIRF